MPPAVPSVDRDAQLHAALRRCDAAIAADPGNAEAHYARGKALHDMGQPAEAAASFAVAIALQPSHASAYNSLGNALQDLQRFAEAIDSYDQAIALRPDYAAAHANRGNAWHSLGHWEAAVHSYDRAIALRPDHAAALSNRGTALRKLHRFADALASYDAAIALRPGVAELHSNRGNALQELRRLEAAIDSYDRAIALRPDYAEAYSNRATALRDLRRFDEALASFAQALAIRPGHPEAIWNRSLVDLLHGRFAAGWRGYDARRMTKQARDGRRFDRPLWRGETGIAGKTILVHWEQGFGDVIQFARYIRLLENAGAHVLFAPQRSLQPLMRHLDARPQIVDLDDAALAALAFDLHCPVMSLPLAFATDFDTIPNAPYLAADAAKAAAWQDWLGAKTGARIGVVWKGRPVPDPGRSIDLASFRRLFDSHCEFVSLQTEATDDERASLHRAGVRHAGDAFADFSDTAALCSAMDLIVTIDTSTAHLAGAMGVPTWLLLPWVPDWRWLLDRDDSPWYPSMRLYRQPVRGDWDTVLHHVALALRHFSPA